MIGKITDSISINIGLSEEVKDIKGKISAGINLTGSVQTTGGSALPDYTGEYEITPAIDAQTLNTKNKTLRDDIEIKEIPYYETSNEYGDTIYIG